MLGEASLKLRPLTITMMSVWIVSGDSDYPKSEFGLGLQLVIETSGGLQLGIVTALKQDNFKRYTYVVS